MLRIVKTLLESTFQCRIYRGWFPRGVNLEFDLKRLLKPSANNILDVGANVGDTAQWLAKSFPSTKIHACEPVASTFELLKSRTSAAGNVHCHKIALGSCDESRFIQIYDGSENSSFRSNLDSKPLGQESVLVRTLDSFCKDQSIDCVDFLKIDTEGHDLEVVRGATQAFASAGVKVLLAELGFSRQNSKHVHFSDFLQEMQLRSMVLFGVYDQRREFCNLQHLRRADCLFISQQHSFPGLIDSPDV